MTITSNQKIGPMIEPTTFKVGYHRPGNKGILTVKIYKSSSARQKAIEKLKKDGCFIRYTESY